MRRNLLGATDLAVSPIGLGTAAWGRSVGEDNAARQLKRFVAAGGNLVDTADIYGWNSNCEELIGHLLNKVVSRGDIVLATKAGATVGPRGVIPDTSREHLSRALDSSLRRMRTEYVDLWQIHSWGTTTPIEESLATLEWAVSTGRARCCGVSNFSGWQTAKSAALLAGNGQIRLASVQVEYSLLERGIEREVVPAAMDQNLSVIAWAPLGRGVLTGKYQSGVPDRRAANEVFQRYVGRFLTEKSKTIVDHVVEIARSLDTTPARVAVAWLLGRAQVASVLVGAKSVEQLEPSLGGDLLSLPQEAQELLDEVSMPYIGYPERNWAIQI